MKITITPNKINLRPEQKKIVIYKSGVTAMSLQQLFDYLQDILKAGDNVNLAVNPTAKTITISATGGGGGIDWNELKTKFIAGTNMQIAVNDIAQTLTFNFTGTIPTDISQLADSMGLLFSGSYTDLSDKPTIPAAQVNSDWNATTGVAEILNKPTIPTNSDFNLSDLGDVDDTDKATGKILEVDSEGNHIYVDKPTGGGSSLEVGRTITVTAGSPATDDLLTTDNNKLLSFSGNDSSITTNLIVNENTFAQNNIITIRQSSVGFFKITAQNANVTILGGAKSWGQHSVMTVFFLDINTVLCIGGQTA